MSVVALERTGRGQRPVPDAKKDWEDEYHRLYEKHQDLTRKYNEGETTRIQYDDLFKLNLIYLTTIFR